MMNCLRCENGIFVEARYPLDSTECDWDEALSKAGYFEQLRFLTKEDSMPSAVNIYQHTGDKEGIPHFLINLWGKESEIALLVADDLNHLLATLTIIEPLTRYSTHLPD